jgi:bifunctional DNA-binding transcriptional regulator/antitoxin component of YhaV-PrlF toxin-antitoxin module
MMFLHDKLKFMKSDICHLTERGQVSFPAALRRQMQLKPGQRLRWEAVSANEARIFVEPDEKPNPEKALGYGPRLRGGPARPTAEWIRELRAGE